jgi:hypothetical protein
MIKTEKNDVMAINIKYIHLTSTTQVLKKSVLLQHKNAVAS